MHILTNKTYAVTMYIVRVYTFLNVQPKIIFLVKLNVFLEARVWILFIETCYFFQSSNERIHFIHFDVIIAKCTAYVLLKTSRGERHEKLEKSQKI